MQQSEKQDSFGRQRKFSNRKIASWVLLIVGIGLLVSSARSLFPPAPTHTEPIAPVQSAPPVQPVQPIPEKSESSPDPNALLYDKDFLKDKLYVTQERADYQAGQMVLKIPRMGLDIEIQARESDMDIGPVLFDYSQLPGAKGCNVSIGAHRDIKGSHFYFIHKLTAGDLFYLIYNEKIYVYEYKDTKVVEPSDWGPIYGQDFDCLTMISCTPIGTSRQRIVVRSQLKETVPYTDHYVYKPWVEGMDKPYAWEHNARSWDEPLQDGPAGDAQ